MIQLMGYLLCIYLIFKGIEIFQMGLTSPKDKKRGAMMLGISALLVSILIAMIFAVQFAEQNIDVPSVFQ